MRRSIETLRSNQRSAPDNDLQLSAGESLRAWLDPSQCPSRRVGMRSVTQRLAAALTAIDSSNADDPQTVLLGTHRVPLASAHGQLECGWIRGVYPDAPRTARPGTKLET